MTTQGEEARSVEYAVVILTWNSRRHIERCLYSLAGASSRRLQLVVVDNGSIDGTADRVAAIAPDAELVRNSRNRGVAAARNQGLKRVRAPYAILLDDDTCVEAGAFDLLLDHLDRRPEIGLAGPRLVLPDGSIQPSCQLFPTLRDKVIRQLPRSLGAPLLAEVELRDRDHLGTLEVDYVVGACQTIRMSALQEVGWLDEGIFYGPEDVDLCLRLQLAGYGVVYLGEAVVRHECQRVTRHRFDGLAWRHLMGLLHYYRTHRYFWSRSGLYRRISRARRLSMGEGA